MSYYILPKKYSEIDFDAVIDDVQELDLYISHSLHNYMSNATEQISKVDYVSTIYLNKIINPLEFIFTNVPNSKLSVSKLKPFSSLFYILMEIRNIFNLFETFADKDICTLSYGENSKSVVEFLNMTREDNNDINFEQTTVDSNFGEDIDKMNKYDFLYYELSETDYKGDNYINGIVTILCNIFYNQKAGGVSIIKIDNIYYKPIIEFIYSLTCIYDKVYIIKPIVSDVLKNEKFIICRNFDFSPQNSKTYYQYFIKLNNIVRGVRDTNKKIVSLIKSEIPYYFLNKIEELNIIMGFQQLEYMDQLVNLHKNKNKEDKIDLLKKNNIQRCIQWCEKYKIPYNKFTDKINIFLSGDK